MVARQGADRVLVLREPGQPLGGMSGQGLVFGRKPLKLVEQLGTDWIVGLAHRWR